MTPIANIRKETNSTVQRKNTEGRIMLLVVIASILSNRIDGVLLYRNGVFDRFVGMDYGLWLVRTYFIAALLIYIASLSEFGLASVRNQIQVAFRSVMSRKRYLLLLPALLFQYRESELRSDGIAVDAYHDVGFGSRYSWLVFFATLLLIVMYKSYISNRTRSGYPRI